MRYPTKLFLDPQDISLIQIKNILAPDADDWKSCKLDITKCTPAQLKQVQGEYFVNIFILT